jgi:hypothetical protein
MRNLAMIPTINPNITHPIMLMSDSPFLSLFGRDPVYRKPRL